ncbi:hypothetical protein HMPREF9454_00786 [Megamonas funiformis YIT 11815]|jgi:hypothetical protein|uniref:Uncharacterized protein n=1 Tax=Megamonas funiformis YIT 11815 TaxID=742816 RepID=A0ABP2NLB1_9FIRM|nr:hypothetical protein HMPREF9454_00786 [Megamonas funiformis YIT 11815]
MILLNILYAFIVIFSFIGTIGSFIAIPIALYKRKTSIAPRVIFAFVINLFVLIVSCTLFQPTK